MYIVALILTIIGWAFQAYETLVRKTRNINIFLPLLYVAGCILFGINSLLARDIVSSVLELITIVLVAIVFIVLLKKGKVAWK